MAKKQFTNAFSRYIIIIGLIMVFGGGSSMLLNPNHDWMALHLSRLGEGRQLSSYLFNATVAFSGLAIIELGNALARDKTWRARAKKPQQWVAHSAFRLIALCMVGLSIFPYDKFPLVHDVFGYSMTVFYLASVIYLTRALRLFTPTFKRITWGVVGVMFIMFGYYFILGNRQITLLQIQVIGLVFFFVWLARLASGLSAQNQRVAP